MFSKYDTDLKATGTMLRKNRKGKSHHMLNKNSIKTILNVKHTCIDKSGWTHNHK